MCMYVIHFCFWVFNSLNIFRFPISVPWIRYHGYYKDLSINLIYPGKDRDLGGCFISCFLLLCNVCVMFHLILLSFTFTIMWSNFECWVNLLVAQKGNKILTLNLLNIQLFKANVFLILECQFSVFYWR